MTFSGGPLQIDPVTGQPVSSGGITLSDLTQSLIAGQTATASSIANLSTTTSAITTAVDGTNTSLNVFNDAITSIGTTATAAGSAITQSATVSAAAVASATDAVVAQAALVSKFESFLDTPEGTAITNPSSNPVAGGGTLAYAAITGSALGGGQQGGINITINNPVETSQTQAMQVGQQLVTTLRNVTGLKL